MLRTTSLRRLSRFGAGLTACALATAGLVLAGAPAAQAAPVVLTPVDVDTSATRATGHNDFKADGVRVWTEGSTSLDKATGYFDVHQSLADVGEPSMDWSNNQPALNYRPGLQLKTDFDGDGDIDGILVGEPILADGTTFLGDEWWLAEGKAEVKNTAGVPFDAAHPSYRQYIGSLDEWRAAFPGADVLESGWSLGSGAHGDGVIYGITVGGTEHLFSSQQAETTELLHASDVDTSETRATGHNEFRLTSGVRVWTEGNTSTDKAAGYFAVGQPFSAVGEPSMDWRANGANTVRPGLQLVVDIDGDGAADGILVGEPTYANGSPLYKDIGFATNWWLTNGSTQAFKDLAPSDDGGNGSSNNGTLAEWRGALSEDATVVAAGWSLGSGVKGDGVIEEITVGLTTYQFTGANQAPVAPDATASVRAGESVTITLPGSDPDGDPLTYEVDNGMLDGDQVTFDADPGFVGSQEIDYTIADDRGGFASGTVTVNVRKALSTTTAVVKPSQVTSKRTVRVRVKVTSTGDTTGGEVVVRDNGKKADSGEIVAGKAVVVLDKKLTKGKHVLEVRFGGTDYTKKSSTSTTVRVKR